MKALLLIALLALTPVLASCGKNNDPLFDAKVRSYLLEHPEVIEEAMVALQQKRLEEATGKAQAAISKHRAALERDPRDFVANPKGVITVTQFFDYRCGYCKLAAPQVLKLIEENPDVRFVFKELPIFGGLSDRAAAAALATKAQGRYLETYRAFFSEQALDDAGIDRIVTRLGLDPAAIKAAGGGAGVQRHLIDTHTLSTIMGIEGTPAFFIGDQMIPGADIPSIRAAIVRERKKA